MSERLYSPAVIRAVMERHHLRFTKALGQNFLIDGNLVHKIIETAEVQPGDVVLEVGPGIGTLTQALLEAGAIVVSVELDRTFFPVLRATFGQNERFHLLEGDALKLDLGDALSHIAPVGTPVKVVANVPYYITTPIIMGLFEGGVPIDNITVMVQKEVAERMQVGPGSKDYGALSLAVQYYADAYIVANVPPNCFIPRPGVGSAVIRLTRHKEPPVEVDDPKLMFKLIRASFNQRRKTLQNGLNNSPELPFDKEEIGAAIESLGVTPQIRGEALTLKQFADLSNYFTRNRG